MYVKSHITSSDPSEHCFLANVFTILFFIPVIFLIFPLYKVLCVDFFFFLHPSGISSLTMLLASTPGS